MNFYFFYFDTNKENFTAKEKVQGPSHKRPGQVSEMLVLDLKLQLTVWGTHTVRCEPHQAGAG